MILHFIRHGQTEWNVKRLFQGRMDIPVNEVGRQQAKDAAKRLRGEGVRFVRVISSPLVRALETASIISGFDKDRIETDDRLAEMEFGPLDGTAFDADTPFLQTFFHDPEASRPLDGMESYDELLARTDDFLKDICRQAAPGDDHVLILTHGALLRALVSHLDHIPLKDFWGIRFDNCESVCYRIDSPDAQPVRVGI